MFPRKKSRGQGPGAYEIVAGGGGGVELIFVGEGRGGVPETQSAVESGTSFWVSETVAVTSETLTKSTSNQSLDQFHTVELPRFSKSTNKT